MEQERYSRQLCPSAGKRITGSLSRAGSYSQVIILLLLLILRQIRQKSQPATADPTFSAAWGRRKKRRNSYWIKIMLNQRWRKLHTPGKKIPQKLNDFLSLFNCFFFSILTLIRHYPIGRRNFFLITFNWLANAMVYNGLSYYSANLNVSSHLGFFIR